MTEVNAHTRSARTHASKQRRRNPSVPVPSGTKLHWVVQQVDAGSSHSSPGSTTPSPHEYRYVPLHTASNAVSARGIGAVF